MSGENFVQMTPEQREEFKKAMAKMRQDMRTQGEDMRKASEEARKAWAQAYKVAPGAKAWTRDGKTFMLDGKQWVFPQGQFKGDAKSFMLDGKVPDGQFKPGMKGFMLDSKQWVFPQGQFKGMDPSDAKKFFTPEELKEWQGGFDFAPEAPSATPEGKHKDIVIEDGKVIVRQLSNGKVEIEVHRKNGKVEKHIFGGTNQVHAVPGWSYGKAPKAKIWLTNPPSAVTIIPAPAAPRPSVEAPEPAEKPEQAEKAEPVEKPEPAPAPAPAPQPTV
jgi:hypothetical protein